MRARSALSATGTCDGEDTVDRSALNGTSADDFPDTVALDVFIGFIVSGAWIITGGTHTGVMKLVGEAAQEYMLESGTSTKQFVVLGIVTWGIIDNRQILIQRHVSQPYATTCSFTTVSSS